MPQLHLFTTDDSYYFLRAHWVPGAVLVLSTNIHGNPAEWGLIYIPANISCLDYGQAAQLACLIPQRCLPIAPTPLLPMDTVKSASLALRVNFGQRQAGWVLSFPLISNLGGGDRQWVVMA